MVSTERIVAIVGRLGVSRGAPFADRRLVIAYLPSAANRLRGRGRKRLWPDLRTRSAAPICAERSGTSPGLGELGGR